MSQTYMTRQRRPAARPAVGRAAAAPDLDRSRADRPVQSAPEGGMGARLDEMMQARIQQHFLDQQIPQAEREADRLSAGLGARTPEEVKARMGERLGADFSAVRFHTGSGAMRAADGIGARAYATGGDIYFGEGGFDPAVAAHELVHTVQQGLVESSTPTVSAPAGQVQMMPKFLKKIGSGISDAASWAWRKTGGKLQRDNHDAMIELHEAIQSGDWDALSPEEQKAWKRKNPIAYRKYMKGGEKVRQETQARIQKRQNEQNAAADFLKNMGPVHSSALGKKGAPGTGGTEVNADNVEHDPLDTVGGMIDTANTVAIDPTFGVAKDTLNFIEDTASAGQRAVGGISSGFGMVNDLFTGIQSGRDMVRAAKEGDAAGVADSGAGVLGSTFSFLGNGSNFLGSVINGASSGFSEFGGAMGAASGIINAGRGVYHAKQGFQQRNAMSSFMEEEFGDKTREDLEGEDLLYRDMAALGKMKGTKDAVEGVSDVVTGAMDATAGVLDAAGVSSAAGAVLHGLSAGTKIGTKIYSAVQDDRMKKKVTEQTTGITDEKIKEFMKVSGINNFSRAKQALMKASGYETGQRKELFADQTEKRSRHVARNARRDDERAKKFAGGLGVKADENGDYDEGKIFEAMGGKESRSQIASKKFSIRAKAQARRSAAQQPAAPAQTGAQPAVDPAQTAELFSVLPTLAPDSGAGTAASKIAGNLSGVASGVTDAARKSGGLAGGAIGAAGGSIAAAAGGKKSRWQSFKDKFKRKK